MPDDPNTNPVSLQTPKPSFVVDSPPPAPTTEGNAAPVATENVETPPPPIVSQEDQAQNENENNGSYGIPPVVTTPSFKGKSKKGTVAAILGILLLIGGVGAGVFLVQRQQNIRDKAAGTAACDADCGNGQYSNFYQTPYSIGPFPQSGKVVVYYSPLGNSPSRTIYLKHNGQTYNITVINRQRIVTNIQVAAGESVELSRIVENALPSPLPDCAPDPDPDDLGWKTVNENSTCGSGLHGPPSACSQFEYKDVSGEISWAQGYGQTVLSKQCWADWMEWAYDYDFNDFFVQFSYEPVAQTPTPTPTPPGATVTPTPTSTPGATITPTPTPPAGFFQCLNIKVYDTNWTLLSPTDLTKLEVGKKVRFTVAGNTSYGQITKAVFSINNACVVVTTTKPGSSITNVSPEFYYEYAIPAGITSFFVDARLYVEGIGWMGKPKIGPDVYTCLDEPEPTSNAATD